MVYGGWPAVGSNMSSIVCSSAGPMVAAAIDAARRGLATIGELNLRQLPAGIPVHALEGWNPPGRGRWSQPRFDQRPGQRGSGQRRRPGFQKVIAGTEGCGSARRGTRRMRERLRARAAGSR